MTTSTPPTSSPALVRKGATPSVTSPVTPSLPQSGNSSMATLVPTTTTTKQSSQTSQKQQKQSKLERVLASTFGDNGGKKEEKSQSQSQTQDVKTSSDGGVAFYEPRTQFSPWDMPRQF